MRPSALADEQGICTMIFSTDDFCESTQADLANRNRVPGHDEEELVTHEGLVGL